jgi:hypothetical protein
MPSVSKTKLEAWAYCGAVPCTRRFLQHPSIPHEVNLNNMSDSPRTTDVADDNVPINWQLLTMKQMEQKNKEACQKLNELGFNGDVFKIERSKYRTMYLSTVD